MQRVLATIAMALAAVMLASTLGAANLIIRAVLPGSGPGQAGPGMSGGAIGQLAEVESEVDIARMAELAALNDDVFRNDTVSTNATGLTTIDLLDGTQIAMGNDARITLDSYVYDPEAPENGGSLTLSLLEGTLLVISGLIADPEAEAITISAGESGQYGTIGIRGTAVMVDLDSASGALQTVMLPETDGSAGQAELRVDQAGDGSFIQTVPITEALEVIEVIDEDAGSGLDRVARRIGRTNITELRNRADEAFKATRPFFENRSADDTHAERSGIADDINVPALSLGKEIVHINDTCTPIELRNSGTAGAALNQISVEPARLFETGCLSGTNVNRCVTFLAADSSCWIGVTLVDQPDGKQWEHGTLTVQLGTGQLGTGAVTRDIKANLERIVITDCPDRAQLDSFQPSSGDTLNGCDLQGVNWSGAEGALLDLKGIQLEGADLTGASLRHVDFSNANLKGAKLIGADLANSSLTNAWLNRAVLDGANGQAMYLDGADFSYASLRGVNFPDIADVDYAVLMNADLSHAQMTGFVWFDGVDFSNAILRGMQFTNAYFAYNSSLQNADFAYADLSVATFAHDEETLLADKPNFSGATWTDGSVCAARSIGQCVTEN